MKTKEIYCNLLEDSRLVRLNEVLASPYPYELRMVDVGHDLIAEATFESEGGLYTYHMVLYTLRFKDGDLAIQGNIIFTDEDEDITLTGRGDAFRVMATVLAITRKIGNNKSVINQYLKKHLGNEDFQNLESEGKIPDKVGVLKFSADEDEPSRVRLYRRITKSLSGYNVFEPKVGVFYLIVDTLLNKKQEIIKS